MHSSYASLIDWILCSGLCSSASEAFRLGLMGTLTYEFYRHYALHCSGDEPDFWLADIAYSLGFILLGGYLSGLYYISITNGFTTHKALPIEVWTFGFFVDLFLSRLLARKAEMVRGLASIGEDIDNLQKQVTSEYPQRPPEDSSGVS